MPNYRSYSLRSLWVAPSWRCGGYRCSAGSAHRCGTLPSRRPFVEITPHRPSVPVSIVGCQAPLGRIGPSEPVAVDQKRRLVAMFGDKADSRLPGPGKIICGDRQGWPLMCRRMSPRERPACPQPKSPPHGQHAKKSRFPTIGSPAHATPRSTETRRTMQADRRVVKSDRTVALAFTRECRPLPPGAVQRIAPA